ncbi:cytochrome c biogenesis CcdA family protein [Mycobacterium sp. AMU20-3851]|uniref:cytochrome c biogenesis CcdA family protein n=1 Tax=Mycobacterium sp. AMU20-3851 TaxID=3122055 RepID=UPI0037546130
MDGDLLGLAFGAGLIAAVNPCGFAMLPGYLSLVVQADAGSGRAVWRALGATAAMTLGVVGVFAAFGALTASVASTVQKYVPFATVLIGVILVLLGGWLLLGRTLSLPVRAGSRWAPTARIGSMLGYGLGFALASLSCTVGPFLAVTASAARAPSWRDTALVYLAYAGGFALIVGALAVSTAFASSALLDRIRRILPYVNRISGALLVAVGVYVTYYGVYEIRLFHAGGDPADPVVGAAGRLQGAIAGWVYDHGGWPWLALLLAVLVVSAAVAIGFSRRAKRSRP